MAAMYFQMVKQKNAHTYREGNIMQIWLNVYLGGRYMGIPYTMLSTFLFV